MLSDNTQRRMMVYGFVNRCIRTVFSGSICIVLNFIFDFIDKYYKKKEGKWDKTPSGRLKTNQWPTHLNELVL